MKVGVRVKAGRRVGCRLGLGLRVWVRVTVALTLTLTLALALALALLTVAQVAVPLILLRHHELVRVETLEEEVEAREPRHLARVRVRV